MPSLDFVIDITEKLKKQDIDYLIITVQKGKKSKIHLFENITDPSSISSIIDGIKSFEGVVKDILLDKKTKNKKNKDGK